MRFLTAVLFLLVFHFPASALEFRFAAPEEAAAILTARDNYMARMSAAEIAIRMESETADKTAADLRARYRKTVRSWSDEEKQKYATLLETARQRLQTIAHLLPETILLIRATAEVEGGLPHTRGNAIVFPGTKEISPGLLYHEVFHVLSRNQPARRRSLYALIGFDECVLDEPPAVSAVHLTNPDVPDAGAYLAMEREAGPFNVVPFLFAAHPAFNPAVEGGFPGHFGFALMKVRVEEGVCTPALVDGEPVLLAAEAVPEFFAAIGKNTGYIIHPEEILASNFALLMTGAEDVPNPEILVRLEAWLDHPPANASRK